MARRLVQLAELDVTVLKGVGAKHEGSLREAFGIETVLDLLTHYPRSYIDRSRQAQLSDLAIGDEAMVLVTVQRISGRRTRGPRSRALVTADVTDGSGHLRVTFFNQAWREHQLAPGTQAILFGKVDSYQGRRQMTNPVVDLVGDRTGRIIPIYPQSEKHRLNSWDQARWLGEVLERAGEFAEPVPEAMLDRLSLEGRTWAFRHIHNPEALAEKDRARRRLVFDELLRLQLALVLRKRVVERESRGIRHTTAEGGGPLVRRFHEHLPFSLTVAQQRTLAEITADLAGPHPMHRLLQGDVGSGKTVVAVSALLVAVQGGHQGALMAPTEVLAEQHHAAVHVMLDGISVGDDQNLFGDRPVRVELLTNRTTATERKAILAGLKSGEVDIVIGTHALIQGDIGFASLGVAVIDEQHRFGVEQRAALRDKGDTGATPDVLVMTATPIPRTAAMTVYGDLDVSVLDEMPPGRTPVTTTQVPTAEEDTVWEAVRAEVSAGRQAYVVCPLIEESEKLEAASAQDTFDRLTAPEDGALAGLRVELLHGRVAAAEKEAVMGRFRAGEVDVLVATTVIEVGVDVPNATVMVVLDADRFGIAQLHQLRGRVGRGAHRSSCYLVSETSTPEADARLAAMVRTTDGFELAEVDLDLRGEGTILGERQKGRNDLKLASLRKDREWVEVAREAAFELVDADPALSAHPLLRDELELFLDPDDAEFLLKG